MKKLILTTVVLFAFGFANAQSGAFKVGAHIGLPTGSINDYSSVNLGADVAYVWKVAESFHAGVTSGYTSFIGKHSYESVGFIPIAATGQYALNSNWFLGVDLGYAIGVDSGNNGGFLYLPKVGYNTNEMEVYVGYEGITRNGGTVSSVNLGVNFKL